MAQPVTGDQLRAAFDVAFGTIALPALHEDAVYITGPATTPTLFGVAAKMVLEAARSGSGAQPVDSQNAVLYGQLTAKLGALLEWWLDWLNKPLGDSQEPEAAQRQDVVAANTDMSGGPPLSREEALAERLRAEGRSATQRDLYHEIDEPYLDSMPERQELVRTCWELAALLRGHPAPEHRAACQLGLDAGGFLEALVGGPEGKLAREVGHRKSVLVEASSSLGIKAAKSIDEAAEKCTAAFREGRWRRDGEDIYWSDVVLAARRGLETRDGPDQKAGRDATATGRRRDPAELLELLANDDSAVQISVQELTAYFGNDKSTIYKWMKARGFPRPQDQMVDFREVAEWLKTNRVKKKPDHNALPRRIREFVQVIKDQVREQERQARTDAYGRQHDDGGASDDD